jgi:peptidoglycan/LPS O-acetylase OafA/YrhL
LEKIQSGDRGYIVGLNSLRFFAFLFIFIFHASGISILNNVRLKFFFLLSGFILTTASIAHLSEKRLSVNWAIQFLIKRLARLGSVYYLILLFSFFVLPVIAKFLSGHVPSMPERPWLYFTLLSNYDNSDHIYLLKFLWAISVEWQLYLLFAFAGIVTRFRPFFMAMIGFLLFSILALLDSFGFIRMDYFGTESYVIYFSSGILLSYIVSEFSKKTVYLSLAFFLIPIILLLLSFGSNTNLPFSDLLSLLLSSLFVLLVYHSQSFLRGILFSDSPTERLGRISYGLYAFSGLALTLFRFLFGQHFGVGGIVLTLLFLILVAELSYRYYERPIYLFVKNRFTG